MFAIPLSSASCFVSTSVTGRPAERNVIAMPPPIVPAPITATRSTGRTGVASFTSEMRAAARSAKNACRSARDSGDCKSSRNSRRSCAGPCSNGIETAAAIASMHLRGAG
jgi:hypothetical protein